MKRTLKHIAAGLLAAAAVCGVSSCGGSNGESTITTAGNSESTTAGNDRTESGDDSSWENLLSFAETSAPVIVDPKTVDYSNIDYTFGMTDGAEMEKFAGEMINATYDGKVVKITGRNSNWGTTCNIMCESGEGSSFGIEWVYVDDLAAPPDDVNLELTGVIVPYGEWGGRHLVVLPENSKVVKSDGTPWASELNYSGNIDITVDWEDMDALKDLSDQFELYTNCEYTGKTVKIDGVTILYMDGEIGIPSAEDKFTYTSVTYQLPEGEEFPPQSYHIQLIGEVQSVDDYGTQAIVVDPANIAVIAPYSYEN